MSSHIYLLTGTTGLLGSEFLNTLLTQDPTAYCYCLIRDEPQQTAAQRLTHIVEQSGLTHNAHRVSALSGDITLDKLGLDTQTYDQLSQKITHIVHSAALVKFTKPIAELEKINVHGTENVITFAHCVAKNNPNFFVLGYVSTAYVAGKRKGIVTEQDFTDRYGFKNNYERTKFSAEALVHAAKETLPVIIFRPSIILGHSHDGCTTRNNVIFPLVQIAKKSPWHIVPFNKNCLLDFISVDQVAKSMLFLINDQDALGQIFHLTCGIGSERRIQQQLDVFNRLYRINFLTIPTWTFPLIKHLLPLTRQGAYIIRGLEPFHLYTVANPQFCQSYTQSMLNKYEVSCDNSADLFEKTVHYMDQHLFN